MAKNVDKRLRSEVLNMLNYIQRLRQEIAALSRRADDMSEFESMSDQLDAIVTATEEATNTILQAVEGIGDLVEKVREQADGEARGRLCDEVQAKVVDAMQACGFQDLTGQRVSKIVGSVKFVEERVTAMAELYGSEAIEALAEESAAEAEPEGDAALLHGPQRPGQAISQEEIDKLFG